MDIVQELRNCSDDNRREIALKLAQTETLTAFYEIRNMVEGRIRKFSDLTFRTLFLPIPIWYSLSDQYIGVEAMGETNTREALSYLTRLYTPHSKEERRSKHSSFGSDVIEDNWKVEVNSYPDAPKALARKLKYELGITTCNWGNEQEINPDNIEKSRQGFLNNNEIHRIFRTAISKLEASV